jgi:hypothetical protein
MAFPPNKSMNTERRRYNQIVAGIATVKNRMNSLCYNQDLGQLLGKATSG